MTAGNWVPELVEIAGGKNVLSEHNQHSPWLDWSKLVEADPDFLIFMPYGWSISRAGRTALDHKPSRMARAQRGSLATRLHRGRPPLLQSPSIALVHD